MEITKKSKYRYIANGIFLLHATSMLGLFVGAVLSFYYRSLAPYEFAIGCAVVAMHLIYNACPFTGLEIFYRKKYDPDFNFEGTFYGHYLFEKLLGITATKKQVKIFLIVTKIIPSLAPIGIILGWY